MGEWGEDIKLSELRAQCGEREMPPMWGGITPPPGLSGSPRANDNAVFTYIRALQRLSTMRGAYANDIR